MQNKPLCIGILEDEVLIAEALCELLRSLGYSNLVVANTFAEGVELLNAHALDLLLLDIHLKDVQDGIDFATMVRQKLAIPIIFISSHSDSHTVQRASETRPNGYLLKPFDEQRLFTAIETAIANFGESAVPTAAAPEAIFVKERNQNYARLRLDDLLWFKSDGNYLELYTAEKQFLVRSSIREFLARYPDLPFVRIHKSHVVRLAAIDNIGHSSVTIAATELPLSRNYREQLFQKIERLT